MNCDLAEMLNRVQQHPCNPAAIDFNWDQVKHQFDVVHDNMRRLEDCPTHSLRRFALDGPLSLMGSAPALLQLWDGSVYVDDPDEAMIVVKDINQAPGKFQGAVGYGGWCVQETGSTTNWHIVEMENKARWVRYRLLEDLVSSSAEATVIDYAQGMNPGAEVYVYDPDGHFRFFHWEQSEGIAFWNDRNSRYEIVTPQLTNLFGHAELQTDLCGGATADTTDYRPYFQGYYSHPRGTGALVAVNDWTHAAEAGERLLLMTVRNGNSLATTVDEALDYVVIDAPKKERNFLSNVFVDDEGLNCALKGTLKRVFVEACDDDETEVTLHAFTQIDVPVDYYTESAAGSHCRVKADMRKLCVVADKGSATDINVLQMSAVTVLTDVYGSYDHSDDDDPLTLPSCGINGTTRVLWVLCYEDPTPNVPLIELAITDVVTSFTVDEVGTDVCRVLAHTTKYCMIQPTFEDNPIDGDDIVVVECTKQEFLSDVELTTDWIVGTQWDGFFICVRNEQSVDLIELEDCEDAVIDEGEI